MGDVQSHERAILSRGRAKFWIPNPTVLQAFGGWAAVRQLDAGALAAAGIGDTPVDGTILKELSNPTVWRIEGGQKRWITTPTVLANYGGWAAVRRVPDGAMNRFPQGPDLTS